MSVNFFKNLLFESYFFQRILHSVFFLFLKVNQIYAFFLFVQNYIQFSWLEIGKLFKLNTLTYRGIKIVNNLCKLCMFNTCTVH